MSKKTKTAGKKKTMSEQTAAAPASATKTEVEPTKSTPASTAALILRSAPERVLRSIPTDKTTNVFGWNVRSKAAVLANDGPGEGQYGIGTFAKEDDDKTGLKKGDPETGMVAMLWREGQLTPIDVRPDPNKPGHFLIVDGATRFEAKKLLDEAGRDVPRGKKGLIDAWVYETMTEEEAEDRNVIANMGKRDLKVADLAHGIARMGKRHTDTEIAAMIGVEQGYVSKLHRIVRNAPAIGKKWRETPIDIGYIAVGKVAALPVDQREDAWNELIKKSGPKPAGEGADASAWVAKAQEKAKYAGQVLGFLDAHGLIDAAILDFDGNLPELAVAFGFKLKGPGKDGKEATKKQRAKISKEGQDAFDLMRAKVTKESEAIAAEARAEQEGVTPDVVTAANGAN